MEINYKCNLITLWAEEWFNKRKGNKKRFDTSFVESVLKYYEDNGVITTLQNNALDNIIEKWNIKSWLDNHCIRNRLNKSEVVNYLSKK